MIRWIGLAAISLLAACQATEPTSHFSLAGSEWSFAEPAGRFVQFRTEGRLIGNSGCNSFSGQFVQDGDGIDIELGARTEMMCPPLIMQREQAFIDLLKSARRVDASHLTLILKSESGEELATLRRQDWD